MGEHGQTGSHKGQDGLNTRPRQLRAREAPWEGSRRSKLMSRRTERPYKVDGAGELAPHSAAQRSAPEINGPVVQQEFTFLLRETCNPSPSVMAGTAASNDRRAGAGVSKGHSTESNEPATKKPDGLTTWKGLNLADSTTIAGRRLALKPNGGAGPRASVAEKECCAILRDCQEPPDADPHVQWCGGREVNPPGYPIRRMFVGVGHTASRESLTGSCSPVS